MENFMRKGKSGKSDHKRELTRRLIKISGIRDKVKKMVKEEDDANAYYWSLHDQLKELGLYDLAEALKIVADSEAGHKSILEQVEKALEMRIVAEKGGIY